MVNDRRFANFPDYLIRKCTKYRHQLSMHYLSGWSLVAVWKPESLWLPLGKLHFLGEILSPLCAHSRDLSSWQLRIHWNFVTWKMWDSIHKVTP